MKKAKIGVLFLTAAVALSILLAACFSDWTGDTVGETALITINLGGGTSRNPNTWTGPNIVDENILHTIKIGGATVGTGVKIGDNPTYKVRTGSHTVEVRGYDPDTDALLSYAENSINVTVAGPNTCTMPMKQAFEAANNPDWGTAATTISGGGSREYYIFVTSPFNIPSPGSASPSSPFGSVTGITVNIRGNSTITFEGSNSFTIGPNQTVILKDVSLKGTQNNYNPLVSVYGTFKMEGSASVKDNLPGGVNVFSGGTFTMSGGTITGNTGNTGSGDCGGVNVASGGTFIMSGGTIRGNRNINGGGVYINGGSFTMSGGIITDNTATMDGGGVYVGDGIFDISAAGAKYNEWVTSNHADSSQVTTLNVFQGGGTIKRYASPNDPNHDFDVSEGGGW